MKSAFRVLFAVFCLGNIAWGEVVDSDRTADFEVSTPTTYTVNDGGDYTFSGVVSGTGAITKDGVGTLTFSGDNTATGALTVNGGTLTLANYTMFSSLIVNDGVANLTINYSSPRATFPQPSTIVVGSVAGTAAKLNLNAQYSLNQTAAFTLYKNAEVTMNSVNNFAWTSSSPMTFVGGGTVSGTGVWQQGALVNALVTGANAVATVSVKELNIHGNMKVEVQDASSVMNVSSSVTNGTAYGLTKTGAGRLVMTGSTTLGNTVQVKAGTLAISGNAWNTVASFAVTDGATLELGAGSGTNKPITLSGAGAGNAGALNFVGNDATVSGDVTLSAASTISVGTDATGTILGSINGGYVLTKTGAGNLILGGAAGSQLINTDLIINEGQVSASKTFADSNVFANGVTVTVNNGGTLQNTGVDAFGYGANAWTLRLNEGGVYNNASGGNESWKNCRLEMVGGTMQSTTGQTIHFLSGTGVFALAVTGATVENPTVSTILAAIAPRNGSGLKFDVAEGARLDVTGRISAYGTGVYNIEKTGVGTMVLSNTGNSYLGKTTVSAGTLKVLNDSLKTSSNVTVASDATLELGTAGKVVSPVSVVGTGMNNAGAIHFSGDGEVAGALTLTGNTSVVIDSGVTGKLTGGTTGAYTMTVTNGGTLGLSGVQGQTATVVNGGTLEFLGGGSLSGALTLSGVTEVAKSGTGVFSLVGAAEVTSLLSQNISITGGTLELDITNVNAMSGTVTTSVGAFLGVKYSGATPAMVTCTVSGEGGIRKSGTGTVILGSAIASTLNAAEGTLQLGTATASFTGSANLVAAEGAHIDYYVNGSDTNALGGQFSGTGTITKLGTGTVTITKQSSETNPLYSQGNLTISEGTVKLLGSGQQLQFSHSSVVTVAAGATLEGGAHDSLGYGVVGADENFFTLNLYGQLLNSFGNESLRNCDINLYGGTIQNSLANSTGRIDVLSENMRITAKALDGATVENPTISLVKAKLYLRNDVMGDLKSLHLTADSNAQMNVTGPIVQSGSQMGFVKEGAGVVVLSGIGNTYAGTTTVSEGTLRLLTDVSSSSDATVANGATLELGTNGSQTFPVTLAESGTLNFVGAATLSGAVTLTGDANVGVVEDVTGTIQGNIGGDFVLTKTGAGTLILDSNTIASELSVTEGKLFLKNGVISNDVTIASGASVIFSGTVNGNIVLSGTWLGLVDDTEGLTLNDGNLEFTDGVLELPTTGIHDASFDDLFTLGTNATLNGTSDLTEILGILNAALTPESAYLWNLSQDGNSIVANVDRGAVPEPASWLLLLFGLGVLLRKKR